MYKVRDFIAWALTHAAPGSIPVGAVLALPREQCGTEPWHYLFGTVRALTTPDKLRERWDNHYRFKLTEAQYARYTAGWRPADYATDCQGLLDAYLTFECGEPTDINADMNYRLWCTDKGSIAEIDRPFVIGEAVFRANGTGRMTHIGWICGFMPNGAPLVVEARSIDYGVVVTRLSERAFTHRGLMTVKFDYSAAQEPQEEKPMEKIRFEVVSPMHKGDVYLAMQRALNAAGYSDADGAPLDEDGKWGKRSQQAFDTLIADYATPVVPVPEIPAEPADPAPKAKPILVYTVGEHSEITVCHYRTADLPEE